MPRVMATLSVLALVFGVAVASQAKVITLFEDDAAFKDNVKDGAPTKIDNETADVFQGKLALKVSEDVAGKTDRQRYNANITNWSFAIVEAPSKDTDARWITFAWKQAAGKGIMLQMPDKGNWGAVTTPFVKPPAPGTRRYISGENLTGWSGVQVSTDVPKSWTGVVRDLFADFGAFTLTGMAFTPFNNVGLYDSIYLGWTQAELKAVTTAVEPGGKVAATWAELKEGR